MLAKRTQTLNDICELIVDCEHKTAPTQEIGYPSIRTPNIGRGRLILEGVNRVSEEIYREWTKRATPRGGDLILAREAPLGNVATIPENLEVCLGQRTVLIRPNRNKVEPGYLVYLLLGDEIQAKFHAYGSGVTVPHLNVRDIRGLVLPDLPPLTTQRKIAGILSAYDDLIENNTRRIAILEGMAQAIYREWFVHFRFPGHEGVRMVESESGVVPEGWEMVKLADVAEINARSINREEEPDHINYVNISSVSPGRIDQIESLNFPDIPGRARRIVQHGDIIWSTVRPNRRSYSVIFKPMSNLIASTGFAVITALSVPYTYLYYTLTTDEFVGYLVNNATGSAYPAVNSADFENAVIVLPSRKITETFHNVVDNVFGLKHNLTLRNANLRQTRDLLLPRLVSGELDVSEVDIETGGLDV